MLYNRQCNGSSEKCTKGKRKKKKKKKTLADIFFVCIIIVKNRKLFLGSVQYKKYNWIGIFLFIISIVHLFKNGIFMSVIFFSLASSIFFSFLFIQLLYFGRMRLLIAPFLSM